MAPRGLQANDNEVVEGGRDDKNLSKFKKSKNAKSEIQIRIGATRKSMFLASGTREIFNHLRQAFTKAPILRHFNPECHIWIETNASGYAIGGVLNQFTFNHLTSDHLTSNQGQWHPVVYFSRKMIPAKTKYETHDGKLLAIIKVFKT